jgi:uncharacterized protein YcbX
MTTGGPDRAPLVLPVVTAGFAAVKGTAHLPRDAVRLAASGAVGDRALCLVDVAARRVLRTVQNPALLTVVAELDGDVLSVAVPGAAPLSAPVRRTTERLTCEYWGRPVELTLLEGPHDGALGAHLGRDVRLAAAPPAGVVFNGPGVTVLGTASLRDLGARLGRDLLAEAARFRATLVVGTERPYEEEGWLGRALRVGGATLRGGVPVPRCAVVDRSPATSAKDEAVLRTLASYRPRNAAGEPVFGIYADVVAPGVVGPSPIA